MNVMSKVTESILKQSGWYSGRKIEINPCIDLLQERKFEVFQSAITFMKEFGMIDIKVPSPLQQDIIKQYGFEEYDEHSTNLFKTLGDAGDIRCVVPFEVFAKEKLVIVGELYSNHMFLMISESGKLYCDNGKLGDNPIEAWERLFSKESCIAWQNL